MSLVQDASATNDHDVAIESATPTPLEARPDVRKRITDISLTAIVLAGVAALTLGWGVLLVRGAIWLFFG